MKLIKKYEIICNEIVIEFEKKQDITFDYWIGDTIGEVAVLNDTYFYNLTDIIFDLKTNQPKGKINEWFNFIIDNCVNNNKDYKINYQSYCNGAR